MKYFFMLVFALVVKENLAIAYTDCPAHIRFVHGHAFKDAPVKIAINGSVVSKELNFRSATTYKEVPAGKYLISFLDAASEENLGEKEFFAASGKAYTVFLAGPAKGPEGSLYGNESPFIFLDDITPPNPGRWKGHWYRMSETNVVIDFRISDGKNPSKEIYRLINKPNRASYSLADAPAGIYQFNPVLPGSSDPFFNTALNPPAFVQIENIEINSGESIDVFALGNFLGKAPNSLQLSYQKYKSIVNEENGCIQITN